SLTPRISSPAAWSERIAVSRPEPGPFTKTSTFWRPCSMPFLAHESAVTCAANGVDLREPLNPAEPADSHAITFPSLSVSETIVLLNDVLMCAWPIAMFFLTRRRARPRVAGLRGGAISDHLPWHACSSPAKRLRPLATQVPLDLEIGVDVVAELGDLLVGQVAHLRVGREAERGADAARGRLADSVDVREANLEPLLVGQVDAGDSGHLAITSGTA